MENIKHTDTKKSKVILSKGISSPSGHRFEFFADENGIFLIVSNSKDKRSEMFGIDISKFPVLERAVDEHIDYLGW